MAKFQAGVPRHANAGRRKGTPNKIMTKLSELMERQYPDYDPVMAMATIAQDKSVDLMLRVQCHKEVAKYVRPQLRSHTVEGTIGVVDLTVGKMPE